MKQITLEEYAMKRDLLFPEEWELARPNAIILLEKVNAFLADVRIELEWNWEAVVSSGFRPSKPNAAASGAKASGHLFGTAVDLMDKNNHFKLAFEPLIRPDHAGLLRRHGLFMEHPAWTIGENGKGWVHLDMIKRIDRPTRVFKP